MRYLIQLSRATKPDYIFSHLVNANLYAALSSYFLLKTKVIVCRHNADEFYQTNNKKAILLDKIVNRFAPKIVVVSQKAYQHLTSMQFTELLVRKTGVAVAPGTGFGEFGEGYIRFALVQPETVIRNALKKINSFLNPTSRSSSARNRATAAK